MLNCYIAWNLDRTLMLGLGFVLCTLSPTAMASPYYHGPLVQARNACFRGDSGALQHVARGAQKGAFSDIQAYAAYWVCKSDSQKALPWLKKASDMGDGWASQMLARYLSESSAEHPALEVEYLSRAALQGNTWAARELSLIYLNGLNGTQADFKKASYWAQYADDVKEIVPNTFYLAESYRNGWGVPKNPAKAKALYIETMNVLKWAVQGGDPYADMLFYQFYTTYSEGVGISKDAQQAQYWLRQAAAKGYPEAVSILKAQSGDKTHE